MIDITYHTQSQLYSITHESYVLIISYQHSSDNDTVFQYRKDYYELRVSPFSIEDLFRISICLLC